VGQIAVRILFARLALSAGLLIGCLELGAPGCRAQAGVEASPTFTPAPGSLSGSKSAMLPTLFPSSHAANLLVRRNGDILCFSFSGTREGDSNVAIVVSRLPKGSQTWDSAVLVDREDGKSYQNPVPIEDTKGRIWLFNTSQSAGKGQADSQVLKVYSDDGGKTWSKQEVLFGKAGSYLRQPAVAGEDGELLLPIYYSTSEGITHGAETNYSVVEITQDAGKTWRECPVPESGGLVQMNIIKLRPTNYVAFFRSRYADFIYRSTSSNGCDWSRPGRTVLPNNNASIQAVGLRNGDIVIAFDNTRGKSTEHKPQTGPRAPLSVAISPDAGITWTAVRDLEIPDRDANSALNSPGTGNTIEFPGKEEYSYPSIIQTPAGQILVAYTYRRLAIKAVIFEESWITQGTTLGIYKPVK
jgi:predicted neuraminidase